MTNIALSPQEVQELAGGYKRAREQLRELHRQGFYRARLGRVTGQVILERAHYDAVCAGASTSPAPERGTRPTLRAVT